MKTEWKKRAAFAEHAEAVGVPTDHIVAVLGLPGPGAADIVMYSTNVEDDEPPVMSIVLRRNKEKILTPITEPTPVPNFWADLKKRLK